MDEGNLAILVDAKTEYTKQLVTILSPYIYNGMKKIYFDAKEGCFEKGEMENTLREFQRNLSVIPKWNQEIINDEYDTIISESKCDWLEDLIMAVFVSHTRILTSINFSKNKNKINLKIPKVDHFIHQCYIESARCFWKNPYLFDDTINNYEFQRNRREAELMIESQINETIRRQLPVKNILREYLGNDYNETEEPDDDLEGDVSYKENLRKMVKAEIENCSKEKLDKFNISNNDDDCGNDTELVVLEDAVKEAKTTEAKTTEAKTTEAKTTEGGAKETTKSAPTVSFGLEERPKTPQELNTEERNEVDSVITSEVNKLEISPKDDEFKIEELNLDMDDLSLLEEVYTDTVVPTTVESSTPLDTNTDQLKMNITDSLDSSIPVNTNTDQLKMNINDADESSTPVKTIIIDTKKHSKNIKDDNNLEINEYDDDSDDDSNKIKQKVYNRYSKKRDYSFFE